MAEVLDRMGAAAGGRLSARDAVRLRDEGRAERR